MQMKLMPIAIAAGCFLLASCDADWGDSSRYKEDFHYSYPLNPGARLSVEGVNGSVEVTGWEQNTVDIAGTKYASTPEYLHDLQINVDHAPDSVRIRTEGPFAFHGNMGVSYTIHVPRRVLLDDVHTTNGGITVNSVEGNVRLRTTNGGLNIGGTKGDVEATTTNGTIDIDGQTGDARLHTTNGQVKADVRDGRFEADTTNGAIEATLHNPAAEWPVRVESTNGHVELTVDGQKLPDMHVNTSNSAIDLHLPSSASARLHAQTSSSNVSCDFDLLTHGALAKGLLEGTIGNGGPSIDLSTSNGSIAIHKL